MSTTKKPVTKKASGRVTAQKPATAVTSASEWKKAVGRPLELPSGHTALCRNPGMKAFLAAGIIPNSLIPIVTEALSRTGSPSGGVSDAAVEQKLTEQLQTDPKMLTDMMDAIDNVTIYCVIQPPVRSEKWTEEDAAKGECLPTQVGQEISQHDRDPELLYVDEVDFDDKQHIFQWAVGGTRSLERFRQ